ncbi:MAG TPA: glucose-6-phosphate dehydrogenase assembly protein OpcA [Baekduia sp.]|nr:glucose-6-phosphate dehydrogenase assembly protein OpcA [Baekduia sp.]
MSSSADLVWSAQDTTPADAEAALRRMLGELHAADASYVPGRVLNLVCVVDRAWSGEIANRLARVGRYHPSRTVMCAVEPGRRDLDVTATVTVPEKPRAGEAAMARESVVVLCGEQHLQRLDRIVDPLVITDLPTVLWSPHGHPEAVASALHLVQVVLLDGVDEPSPADAVRRACRLSQEAYVVDLAWLRTTPWRERLAAAFDPVARRRELATLERLVVRHHPASQVAALLLAGWLASRLGWEPSQLAERDGTLEGRAHGRRQDVAVRLEPAPEQQVRGLFGVELQSAAGRALRLDRGPGGLRAHERLARGEERAWTILGASRGEAGILGEGIRQALLRDPTYLPAVQAAQVFTGAAG